jgi:hypothetical protein
MLSEIHKYLQLQDLAILAPESLSHFRIRTYVF